MFEVSPPKHEKSRQKFLLPTRSKSSNTQCAEELLFEPTCNGKHQTSASSTFVKRNQNQSSFRRIISSRFNSQTTKTDGIQPKRVYFDGIRRDETHDSNNDDSMAGQYQTVKFKIV